MELTRDDDLSNKTLYCFTSVIVAMAFCMSMLLLCTLTNFIKFHMKLVLENYTTIENLEREEGAKSKFDIGSRFSVPMLGCGGSQCTHKHHGQSVMVFDG